MRVLVTRPLEDGEAIAVRLSAMGHASLLAPLLATHFDDGPEPDFHDVQAILATSANGVRALIRRSARRDIPLFAVGPQTAQAARDAGFATVRDADGDARALAQATARWATPDKGVLLHVSGAQTNGHLAEGLAAHGFVLRKAVLYAVEAATALPGPAREALEKNRIDAALFFSPRSARLFCELAAGISLKDVIGVAISPITAAALAPLAFREVCVAAQPNQEALLAILAER